MFQRELLSFFGVSWKIYWGGFVNAGKFEISSAGLANCRKKELNKTLFAFSVGSDCEFKIV
jgi:hypothetical protein